MFSPLRMIVLACFAGAAAGSTCNSIADASAFCKNTPGKGQFGLIDAAATTECAGTPCSGSLSTTTPGVNAATVTTLTAALATAKANVNATATDATYTAAAAAVATAQAALAAEQAKVVVTTFTDVATCCNQCTVADYVVNQIGSGCENDCHKCLAKDHEDSGKKGLDCERCFCSLTMRPPQKNKVMLNICHMFTENSCCIPVQDTEIDEHYFVMLESGPRCHQELVLPKLFLRDIYCMPCSPDSPKYIVNNTVQICRSLVDKVKPEYFDECGMMTVSTRGCDVACDDSVMPSLQWGTGPDGAKAFVDDVIGAFPPFYDGNTGSTPIAWGVKGMTAADCGAPLNDDGICERYKLNVVEDNTNCYDAGNSGSVKAVFSAAVVLAQMGMLVAALFLHE